MGMSHRQSRGDQSEALLRLTRSDPALRLVWQRLGDPPSWSRPAGLETLVRIILEQKVSLRSAEAVFLRLREASGGRITGRSLSSVRSETMVRCGVSRQKQRYLQAIASEVVENRLRLDELKLQSDEAVRERLTNLLGVGNWSADVYLMSALDRRDILPTGDLGLLKGIEELDGGNYPDFDAVIERAEVWRPYRSTATRLIWALYLDNRGWGG